MKFGFYQDHNVRITVPETCGKPKCRNITDGALAAITSYSDMSVHPGVHIGRMKFDCMPV